MSRGFLLHFRPRTVQPGALRFTLTWGLGGIAVLFLIVQALTGILLSFFYQANIDFAYASVRHLEQSVFLGQLFRNLHHWSGHALVVVLFLHFIRIFYYKAFSGIRKANWYIGLGLGFLVLFSNFSGYLLPWDQRSYWAVTIATGMLEYIPFIGSFLVEFFRGGASIGASTLKVFYSLHTVVLPVLILGLAFYHFWFIRKNKGILVLEPSDSAIPANPHLYVREFAMASIVMCVLLVFSIFFNAPLGQMADSEVTPNLVKAPWYFMGAQELLLHLHPVVAVLILPILTLGFLIALPFLFSRSTPKWAQVVFWAGVGCVIILTFIGNVFRGEGMLWVMPW